MNVPIGSKATKVETQSNSEDFEGSMFGDNVSEAPSMMEEIPEKVQLKLDRLEEHSVKLNLDLKDKNEKLIELMAELEDVKIQVFARDKSIEL